MAQAAHRGAAPAGAPPPATHGAGHMAPGPAPPGRVRRATPHATTADRARRRSDAPHRHRDRPQPLGGHARQARPRHPVDTADAGDAEGAPRPPRHRSDPAPRGDDRAPRAGAARPERLHHLMVPRPAHRGQDPHPTRRLQRELDQSARGAPPRTATHADGGVLSVQALAVAEAAKRDQTARTRGAQTPHVHA